jgi:uncharacterized MAPEG superfamily protein
MFLVFVVMTQRLLTSARETLAGNEGKFMKVCIFALNNSFEQGLIFALNVLGLGTYKDLVSAETLVVFTAAFIVARVVFWVGYVISAYIPIPLRAPGFLFSYFINLTLVVLNVAAFTGKYNSVISFIA